MNAYSFSRKYWQVALRRCDVGHRILHHPHVLEQSDQGLRSPWVVVHYWPSSAEGPECSAGGVLITVLLEDGTSVWTNHLGR